MDESLVFEYPDLEDSHFWWSTRRQLMAKLFLSLDLPAHPTVLDVGCGAAVTGGMLQNMGAEVVGVDASPVFVDTGGATEISKFVVGDYTDVSSGLGQFDLVVALDSVEHFSDEPAVLRSIARNTKLGGVAIVTVPAYSWLWSSHDEQNNHFRRYTRRRLRDALERAGFAVERSGYIFASLVLPKAILAAVENVARRDLSTGTEVPRFTNAMARAYFRWEIGLAFRLRSFLPFGTSVVAVARRPDSQRRIPPEGSK